MRLDRTSTESLPDLHAPDSSERLLCRWRAPACRRKRRCPKGPSLSRTAEVVMAEIGIIGSGIAGLHLGLSLQRPASRSPSTPSARPNSCSRAGSPTWSRATPARGPANGSSASTTGTVRRTTWVGFRSALAAPTRWRSPVAWRRHKPWTCGFTARVCWRISRPGRARGDPHRRGRRAGESRIEARPARRGLGPRDDLEHLPPRRRAIRRTPSRSAWWSPGCSAASAIPSRARSR